MADGAVVAGAGIGHIAGSPGQPGTVATVLDLEIKAVQAAALWLIQAVPGNQEGRRALIAVDRQEPGARCAEVHTDGAFLQGFLIAGGIRRLIGDDMGAGLG